MSGKKKRITVSLDPGVAAGLKAAAEQAGAASVSEYLTQAQREAVVEPHTVTADLRRESDPLYDGFSVPPSSPLQSSQPVLPPAHDPTVPAPGRVTAAIRSSITPGGRPHPRATGRVPRRGRGGRRALAAEETGTSATGLPPPLPPHSSGHRLVIVSASMRVSARTCGPSTMAGSRSARYPA